MINPPHSLRCEFLKNPIEIDTPKPRLSWLLRHKERGVNQTAYHIIVSSQKHFAQLENGDLWDTGKVETENFVNIEYNGKRLESNKQYYWTLILDYHGAEGEGRNSHGLGREFPLSLLFSLPAIAP